SNESTAVPANPASDSAAIAATIHQFYQWYAKTGIKLIEQHDFVDVSGKHPKLDPVVLRQFLGEFVKSATVSQEFVQNEVIYYTACSHAWQNELIDDIPTCLDHNRYYCAQDWDEKEFETAGVKANITGNRAEVQLLLKEVGSNGGPRDFEMTKEFGKWLISKVLCQ
ncbi:MAG: DUF3828 domain-containing protein, partial [Saprospiraceae bacterium]|nr:DUF3828 domain-containing protein [Saprospiraceae bacterium]